MLLIFSPAEDDARLADFDTRLQALACDVGNRDLAVYRWVGSGTVPDKDPRRAYGIDADDFVVILIGKDGGEKHRAEGSADPQEVLGIIDAMPMRQAEAVDDRPCR